MKFLTFLAFASLILAISAQGGTTLDAIQWFEHYADQFGFNSELKSQGKQCVYNLNSTLNSFHDELVSIETLFNHGFFAMSSSELAPCLTAALHFAQYWKIHAKQTNVKQNFLNAHEDIFVNMGLLLIPEAFPKHLSRFVFNFFSMGSLLLGFTNASSPITQIPVPQIPAINPEQFFEEFIAGFMNTGMGIRNKTVVHSISQCAFDTTFLIAHLAEGVYHHEEALIQDMKKTVNSCSVMKKTFGDYWRTNSLPRKNDNKTLAVHIVADFLMNNRLYKGMLARSFEDLAKSNYNYCGRRVGNILSNTLRSLFPVKIEMF